MGIVRGRVLGAAAAALLLLGAACGAETAGEAPPGDAPAPEGGAPPQQRGAGGATPDAAEVEIEAEDFAFQQETVTVGAGARVVVEFKNRDDGVPHNVALYESEAAENEIFVGDIITGEDETTYEFRAPTEAGEYFFRCDVHPQQMTGRFVVS